MTIKELITSLEKYPQDKEVLITTKETDKLKYPNSQEVRIDGTLCLLVRN